MRFLTAIICAVVLPSASAQAFEPDFSGKEQLLLSEVVDDAVLALPAGPFKAGEIPVETTHGALRKRTWRFSSGFSGTHQMSATLQVQLAEQGYDILLACNAQSCGGFDFRFGIEVLTPPNMFVDLSDYFFISAHRLGEDGTEGVTVLISKTAQQGLVQILSVAPGTTKKASPQAAQDNASGSTASSTSRPTQQRPQAQSRTQNEADTAEILVQSGHVVLSDLSFETGSSTLADGPFASLQSLAEFLLANKARRIALVGHTDSKGSYDGNLNLSRKRAASVQTRLSTTYKVPKAQMEARGAAYLAPLASNVTEDGRNQNRRVEAVLLSTED